MTHYGRPPYLWTRPGWIRNPRISELCAERDENIRSMELELANTLGTSRIGEAVAGALADELRASYAIESEHLDKTALYSSVIRELDLDFPEWRTHPRGKARENRIVEATVRFLRDTNPPSRASLCATHGMLGGEQGEQGVKWGTFRTCPIYVVSSTGEAVYEGPSHEQIPGLVERFCEWWNNDRPKLPSSAGAACAHAFFVLVHPFEDGNGRMSRMLAEKALVISSETIFRPYSLSAKILTARKQYAFVLRHIHDPRPENGMDGLEKFISFVQDVREQAIAEAMKNAAGIARLEELLSRLREAGVHLSPEEKTVLKTMCVSNRRWNRFEATADVEDPEKGAAVWRRLIDLGVVRKNRIRFDRGSEQKSEESDFGAFPR